ncbi:MAG: hypothetical protein FWF08_10165 [Oscillospiraceae bacterium]|nr:hypothetical protein [Oscillospiraceae bacterium]
MINSQPEEKYEFDVLHDIIKSMGVQTYTYAAEYYDVAGQFVQKVFAASYKASDGEAVKTFKNAYKKDGLTLVAAYEVLNGLTVDGLEDLAALKGLDEAFKNVRVIYSDPLLMVNLKM